MEIRTIPVGPLGVNAYIILESDALELVVVDPGAQPERILEAVRAAGGRVVAIVDTHFHIDHVGSNAALVEATGAPLMIGRADAPLLEGNFDFGLGPMLRARPSPPPDRLLDHGDRLVIGAEELEVRHCPGHSPGGISLVGPGFVLSGDTLFREGVGRTDFPGCSTSDLMESIHRQLFSLPDETVVYPGHGPATTIGHERRHNPFVAASSP